MTGIRIAVVLRLALCVALFAAFANFQSARAAEQRVALVIGNSAYPSAPLRNPVNDANAMATKLQTLGFDVILRTNASQRDMSRAISDFGKKLKLGSVGLFYFAGHGMQVRGKNFLIPIDAEIDNEASVRGESVDVEQVLDQLGAAKMSMVILDACRNNPFEARFRRVGGGLAQIDAPTGSLLAYATAPGKVAADGAGSNGLYTAALLKALEIQGLKVEDVFKQVRNEVLKESNNQQIPWESSSLTSEFFFKPGTTVQIENVRLQQSEKERAELAREMEKMRAELSKLKGETRVEDNINPLRPSTPMASPTGSWPQRIAQLESARGQLTLSKAVAILLDVDNGDELELLLLHEATLKKLSWFSAYAMGADQNGEIVWGGSRGWRNSNFAADTAIEFCGGRSRASCKVIIENGQFNENNFVEAARQLGAANIPNARKNYMQTLTIAPNEVRVSYNAGGGGGGASYGFASLR